jgi:PAS domain-containing protein
MKTALAAGPFSTNTFRLLPIGMGVAGAWRPGASAAEAVDAAAYRRLLELLAQAPVAICLLRGPAHSIELLNPPAATSWGCSVEQVRDKPFFDALPHLRGQGFEGAYATVWQTQQVVTWQETPIKVVQEASGQGTLGYFDVSFQPLHDGQGRLTGILVTSQEVTEQVLARQRINQATTELAATNAGLADYVQELTQSANAAQVYAESQATVLAQLLDQAPLAMGLLVGPNYVVEVCNPSLRAHWGLSLAQVLHQPLFEVLPELQSQGLRKLLDEVGRTGVPHRAPQPAVQGAPLAAAITLLYQPLGDASEPSIAVVGVAS